MTKVGKRIRELRKEKGLTQAYLAERLERSDSAIRMWESGKNEPSPDTLLILASIFGVSVDYLLGKSDLPTHDLPTDVRTIALHRASDALPDEAKEELIQYAEFLKHKYREQ